MPTFVLRLIPPRPDFAMTMTDDEIALMDRHAEHWQSHIESGRVVVFGPVADDTGSWGLAIAESDDPDGADLRAHVADDPTMESGEFRFEIGTLLTGFVRERLS